MYRNLPTKERIVQLRQMEQHFLRKIVENPNAADLWEREAKCYGDLADKLACK